MPRREITIQEKHDRWLIENEIDPSQVVQNFVENHMESAIQSWRTFTYNFGFNGSLEAVGEENVKETISNYFDSRIDAHLVEFIGNKTPPPGDIMKVRVKARDGYGIIDDLAGERIQMDGDDYVYIIQGGPDTGNAN